MTLTSLPVDSDLSVSSLRWAIDRLGQRPERLLVTREEYQFATEIQRHVSLPFAIGVDGSLSRFSWRLEGFDHAIVSDGG